MATKKTYKSLKAELDAVMAWFEQDEIDIDTALEKYKQANAIIVELETLLKTASLEIKKLH